MESLGFFMDLVLPTATWHEVDSASNINEYQRYLMGVQAAGV